MATKRVLGRNMVWNTAGLAVQTISGFVVMPFLIHQLGEASYGVWIVLGALTSYFGLLDLGIRGAIGRYVALHHANEDADAVNQTLTGGLAILLLVGVVSVVTLVAAEPVFFDIFTVPAELHDSTRVALYVVAAQFAVYLVGTVFEATLWGFQRFDWINMVDIPLSLLRVGLTVGLIRSAGDLALLAWITLGLTSAGCLAKCLLCFRAHPGLRIRPRYLSRRSARELFGYGTWSLILNVAVVTRRQLSPLLIGSLLGLTLVAPYSITERLIATVAAALTAATGVLTPFATALHANEQTDRQRTLFLVGGRYTAAVSVFLISGMIALGGPLITVWIGPKFADAALLVTIIGLGELLPSTQYVTNGILFGCARHQSLAVLGIFETVGACALTVTLIPMFGLVGAAVAIAVPACLTRGVGPMVQACRMIGVPIGHYLLTAILPPVLCGVVPTLAVGAVVMISPPTGWGMLIAYSVLYALLFVVCYACVFGLAELRAVYACVAGVFRRPTNPSPENVP